MTILLVLSFINACWNIFRSVVMYVTTPRLAEMLDSGAFEEMMQPFSAMGEDFTKSMNDTINVLIVSLMGVRRMFKNDKRGFHLYSISQICMLIAHSVYVYPLQKPSPFTSDLLLTAVFIFLYYLYFKRMELANDLPQNPE